MTSRGKKAAEREARRRAAAQAQRRRRIVLVAVAAVAVAVLAFLAFGGEEVPELAAVESFDDLGGGHISEGDPTPEYNSSPATSGRHLSTSAPCGIYTEEVPDLIAVHNLEHGTIVVNYQPDLGSAQIEELETFARSKTSHVLVAPRADIADPVVLTAWTRMLRLPDADLASLEAFYDAYSRRGPEAGVACPMAVDQAQ